MPVADPALGRKGRDRGKSMTLREGYKTKKKTKKKQRNTPTQKQTPHKKQNKKKKEKKELVQDKAPNRIGWEERSATIAFLTTWQKRDGLGGAYPRTRAGLGPRKRGLAKKGGRKKEALAR